MDAMVFFHVDLTVSFCCDFDLFGIATGWSQFQSLKLLKNTQ